MTTTTTRTQQPTTTAQAVAAAREGRLICWRGTLASIRRWEVAYPDIEFRHAGRPQVAGGKVSVFLATRREA